MMGIISSAKEYDNLGFKLVAMQEGRKGPTQANWHNQGVDLNQLSENQNIGLIHNLSSTMCLDIDQREDAIEVFKYLGLDPVLMKQIYPCYRGKKEGIKFIFKMPNIENVGIRKLTYKLENEVITVFELRGSTQATGCQDVLPPSLHPSGIRYEWVNNLPKTYEELPELPERLVEAWLNWEVDEKAMLNVLGHFKPEAVKRQTVNNDNSTEIIDLFNSKYTTTDVLLRNAYEQKGNRFLSPHSTSGMPGLVLLDDGAIYSHHGGDALGDGKSHDAFDVARILESNGDWKTAFNNARNDLGLEKVTYEKPIDERAFKFFHASEAINQATAPKWVIKDIMEEDSLVGLFGSPKTGKSFLSVDMGCCVSTGTEYHGHKTKKGLVIYLAGEGHRGLSRRLLAWEMVKDRKLEHSLFHYSERGAAILDEHDVTMMRNEALTIQDNYKEAPKLFVIDTLARNYGSGDENSTQDMNRWIANVDRFIREEFRCAVMIVHHTGHNENNRGRGSSVLPAALDAEYKVTREGEGQEFTIDLQQTLIKDGRPLEPMRFNFQETEFHNLLDEDGRPTTSGSLVQGVYIAPTKDKPIGKNQKELLEVLEKLYFNKVRLARLDDKDVAEIYVTQEELRDECKRDISKEKSSLLKAGRMEEIETFKFVPENRAEY